MKTIGISLIVLVSAFFNQMLGQDAVITLNNPSFEDYPHAGSSSIAGIKGWYDCGRVEFRKETPPDIHEYNPWNPFFEVVKKPSDGKTFLGMVTRANETWESISQKLSEPLEAGKCYTFSIDLARSEVYNSSMPKEGSIISGVKKETQKSKPAVLRIWGGINYCPRNQLLAESVPITNTEWQTYTFEFTPNINTKAISLEAFYKTPVLDPYFGHILLDNASEIKQIPCPGDEIIAAAEKKPEVKKQKPPHLRRTAKPKPSPNTPIEKKSTTIVEANPKTKILKDLDRKNIYKGQKINIDNLYFEANASEITKESNEVLDEVAAFLLSNKDIIVEIGGHTNNRPTNEFCDSLSRLRAKEVAEYLKKKGVQGSQLHYKGYGKRKPIATNKTRSGRKKNQRVEIKILSIE